jgi:hypothetical protein
MLYYVVFKKKKNVSQLGGFNLWQWKINLIIETSITCTVE